MPEADNEFPRETRGRARRAGKPGRCSNEDPTDADADEPLPARVFDPREDLPGSVFMVPNQDWKIDSLTSDDHPGACTHYREGARQAILVKGTDADNVRSPRRFYFVSPTPRNGLSKETAFELVPRTFRLNRIRLFYPQRHLGWLEDAKLHGLCDELARLHPEE